jgi:chemotaxis methyl-accepting protein methylase/quercetin dioxygenase-like cupin family protein
MSYVNSLPSSVSFTGKGLLGYTFGPLKQKDVDVYYIQVEKGHDTFIISSKVNRTYYVLSGEGYFTIDGNRYAVTPGVLVEVPPRVEYTYSGKMTLIAFCKPRLFSGNDTHTKWNPDVVGRDFPFVLGNGTSLLTRLAGWKVLGKSPLNAFVRLNERLWRMLPSSVTVHSPIRSYGNFLHSLAKVQRMRAQALSTFFFRNRPALELVRRLADRKGEGETLRVAVLGCSTGAEAYSVAWRIRSARPDLKLLMHAVDISRQAVEFGERGVYSLSTAQLSNTDITERMTKTEIEEVFDQDGTIVTVKPWIKEGLQWHVADVGKPELLADLGPQDLVVASNFLCHMDAPEAERCLRNIARLVVPGGYLFASGVDLDIRTKVACELGWKPVQDLLEEIHEGDPVLRKDWPFHYSGLEPLNKRRRDWRTRYATAHEMASGGGCAVEGTCR